MSYPIPAEQGHPMAMKQDTPAPPSAARDHGEVAGRERTFTVVGAADGAPERALFVFPPPGDQPDLLTDRLGHRAIGVVYHPQREHWGNYVPTVLGSRYNAFCWFDETRPVHPLHLPRVDTREPETYPAGV